MKMAPPRHDTAFQGDCQQFVRAIAEMRDETQEIQKSCKTSKIDSWNFSILQCKKSKTNYGERELVSSIMQLFKIWVKCLRFSIQMGQFNCFY
jgi:hypothetical protein